MKRWSTFLLLLSTALSLAACGPKHKEQEPCGFVQNVYGERISWKDSSAIPLLVHESFPTEMLPALKAAIKDWELAIGRPMFRVLQTNYNSAGPQQDGVNVIYWMKTWEADKALEQARTSVYWIGDQIREADIRLNSANFSFYIDTPIDYRSVHLESLLVHELGHVVGLKHKEDAGSVMATYLASQSKRTQISEADKNDLKCEY
jgi:hypothetical protein